MPDGTSRLLGGAARRSSIIWAVHLLELYGVPEIALAKIREDAPFDKVCYIGCGVTTGIGAVIIPRKWKAGANCVVSAGGIGLNVIRPQAGRREYDRRPSI